MRKALLLVIAIALPAQHGRADDLFIRGVLMVDGSGGPPRANVDILIGDGRIRAIEPSGSMAVRGKLIDAAGMTALPGLIDAHVHFIFAPGSGYRKDSPQTVRELNRQHLRAYLACGVTTVLDPGAYPPVVRDIQEWLAAGNPGPRFLTTGPLMRPPGGYGHELYGSVSTVEDVEAKLDLIQSLGGVGVKLAIQEEFKDFPPELRAAIQRGAARRSLPLYIHATSEKGQRAALDMGAHAIMHAVQGGAWTGQVFGGHDLSDDFVRRMAASGAYQLTTFSVLDNWPNMFPRERLDDPLVRLTVPAVELVTARDPQAERFFVQSFFGWFAPWLPGFGQMLVARLFWQTDDLADGLRYSQRNVRTLHAAGVPIVAATDAPSPWPDSSFHFHGPSTLREIELVGEAGLSPMQAIAAATRVPAQMLGLADEIGTVQVGKRADLVIVRGDPLKDLRALRTVMWTVRDGVARTPEEWMTK